MYAVKLHSDKQHDGPHKLESAITISVSLAGTERKSFGGLGKDKGSIINWSSRVMKMA